MRGCLQFLAALTAVLFVLSAVAALFVVNLAATITNRQAFKQAVDLEPFVRANGPQILADTIQDVARQQGVSVQVDATLMRQVVDGLIPPGWIDATADTAVDGLYDYLETGDMGRAVVTLDARPLVERFRGDAGRQAMLLVTQSLPVCADPLAGFDLQSGRFYLPNCVPQLVPVPQASQLLHTTLVATIDVNPDRVAQAGALRISLLDPARTPPETMTQLQRLRAIFQWSRWAWLLWLIPLGCLFLLLLLVVRSWREWGQWWGWPMLLAGALGLFIGVLLPALLTAYFRTAVPPTTDTLNLATGRIARAMLEYLSGLWLRRVYIQAGVLLALGALLALIGFVAGRSRQDDRMLVYDADEWR
jgi:hypothetical protein